MIDPIQVLLRQVANTYNLDQRLLTGQVMAESGGNANAFRYEQNFFERYVLGNVNARAGSFGPLAACSYGLLQIMLETAMEIGYTDRPERLFVPQVGLAWGAKYLQSLLLRAQGNYPKALAAYNAGWGSVSSGPPYPNQVYVSRVYQFGGVPLPKENA